MVLFSHAYIPSLAGLPLLRRETQLGECWPESRLEQRGGGRAGVETRQAGRALPSPPGLRRLHGQTQAARDVRAKHKRNLSQHSWLTAVAKASPTRSIPLLALHWAVGVCSHTHTHTHTHTHREAGVITVSHAELIHSHMPIDAVFYNRPTMFGSQ